LIKSSFPSPLMPAYPCLPAGRGQERGATEEEFAILS
jgi:hypothetical protein